MMHVVVGTDTYGRVKTVDKTAIVTEFWMVQMLPFVPLKSYYVWGPATSEIQGVSLLAPARSVERRGIPLARVDRISVAFAYVRGALAAMVIVGFMGVFTGLIFSRDGRPMDDSAMKMMRLAESCLFTGVVGGVSTYLVPTTGRRERAIRTYCAEMLGVAIDPKRVAPEVAVAVREMLLQPGTPDRSGVPRSRSEYLRALILSRCDAAIDAGLDCDALTDELLDQLGRSDRVASAQPADCELNADGNGLDTSTSSR